MASTILECFISAISAACYSSGLAKLCYVFIQQGHSAEIISLAFNTTGNLMITGSFDHTVCVWNVHTGK